MPVVISTLAKDTNFVITVHFYGCQYSPAPKIQVKPVNNSYDDFKQTYGLTVDEFIKYRLKDKNDIVVYKEKSIIVPVEKMELNIFSSDAMNKLCQWAQTVLEFLTLN